MIEKNSNYRVFDLFAGAGGFSLGFSMADYNINLCLEHDLWACDTLRFNHKHSKVIQSDIRNFDSKEKIEAVIPLIPDVIIGGPPCQGFSNASTNSDINDPRNSLFKNFAFWVNVVKPKVFVMENVAGILTKKNASGEKVIDIITSNFEKLGYSVEIWKLNAADYGVPQIRERIFIVGNSFGKKLGFPRPTHSATDSSLSKHITTGEAILDLPIINAKQGQESQSYTLNPSNEYQKWARGNAKVLTNHVAMKHTERSVSRFKLIQSGELISDIPDDLKVRKRGGKGELSVAFFNSNYRHLKADRVSNTIPASFYSNFIHPITPRNITSREAARIQSFPDNYTFLGKRTLISSKLMRKLGKDEDHLSQYNQIGNAVPPLLAKSIASHIRTFLDLNKIPVEGQIETRSSLECIVL